MLVFLILLLFLFTFIKPFFWWLTRKITGRNLYSNTTINYLISWFLGLISIIISILIVGQITIMISGESGNAISNLRLFDSSPSINEKQAKPLKSQKEINPAKPNLCSNKPTRLKVVLSESEIKYLTETPGIYISNLSSASLATLREKTCQVCLCSIWGYSDKDPFKGVSNDEINQQYSICETMHYDSRSVCDKEINELNPNYQWQRQLD